MESPLKIQPKVTPLPKPLPDKQQLLLLGLQLLNKGLKLPTAVVQPQAQRPARQTSPALSMALKQSPPSSPAKPMSSDDESEREGSVLSPVAGRKRKRNSNDDLSDVQKKEKR